MYHSYLHVKTAVLLATLGSLQSVTFSLLYVSLMDTAAECDIYKLCVQLHIGVFSYIRMYVRIYILHNPLSLLDSVATFTHASTSPLTNVCMHADIAFPVYHALVLLP